VDRLRLEQRLKKLRQPNLSHHPDAATSLEARIAHERTLAKETYLKKLNSREGSFASLQSSPSHAKKSKSSRSRAGTKPFATRKSRKWKSSTSDSSPKSPPPAIPMKRNAKWKIDSELDSESDADSVLYLSQSKGRKAGEDKENDAMEEEERVKEQEKAEEEEGEKAEGEKAEEEEGEKAEEEQGEKAEEEEKGRGGMEDQEVGEREKEIGSTLGEKIENAEECMSACKVCCKRRLVIACYQDGVYVRDYDSGDRYLTAKRTLFKEYHIYKQKQEQVAKKIQALHDERCSIKTEDDMISHGAKMASESAMLTKLQEEVDRVRRDATAISMELLLNGFGELGDALKFDLEFLAALYSDPAN